MIPPNIAQKQAPKRKATSNSNAKKVRSSQDECDRQMALMENDGIVVDLTESVNQPEVDEPYDGMTEDNQVRDRLQSTIDFLQRFKMPTKKVFKLLKPSKKLQDINQAQLNDSCASVVDIVDGSDIVQSPVNTVSTTHIEQPINQLLSTKNVESKSMVNNRRQEAEIIEIERPIDTQKNTKTTDRENEPQSIEQNKDNKNVYLPSRIRAIFTSQSQTIQRKVPTQSENTVPRKKDINFRYVNHYHQHGTLHINFALHISVTVIS